MFLHVSASLPSIYIYHLRQYTDNENMAFNIVGVVAIQPSPRETFFGSCLFTENAVERVKTEIFQLADQIYGVHGEAKHRYAELGRV